MPTLAQRLEAAQFVMSKAAPLALQLFQSRSQFVLEEKNANEFVSEADRRVEAFIRAELGALLPGDAVQGEEMGGVVEDAFWSVDPIDGTSNFLRGSPLWGVSLGYFEGGRSRVGVIHYPALGQTLSAATGLGIWHQGAPFRRHVDFPDVRVTAVGDSTRWALESIEELCGVLRRSGSGVAQYRCASIGLGFAALGHIDGYIEHYLSVWDLAAGAVICEEAGLVVEYSGGYESQGMSIRAATPAVHAVVRQTVARPNT